MELKREEAKLIREIKAAAKTGNQASTRILAKSLVRIRSQMTKMQGSKAQLMGVSTQMKVRWVLVWMLLSIGQAWLLLAIQPHNCRIHVLGGWCAGLHGVLVVCCT